MENVKTAATLVLIRNRADHAGIEVYMTKRPDSMAFLPGYYVFPGGVMQEDDRDPELLHLCRKQFPDVHTSYAITAIRECFEEVGYLLADVQAPPASQASLPAQATNTTEQLQNIRDRLNDKTLSFRDWILEHQLTLRTDLVRYYGHRITPRNKLPRRFDTRYFLTIVAHNQILEPCRREVEQALWIDPVDALEKAFAGSYQMVLPTRDVLLDLARFKKAEDAFQLAAGVGTPQPHELA